MLKLIRDNFIITLEALFDTAEEISNIEWFLTNRNQEVKIYETDINDEAFKLKLNIDLTVY